MPNLKSNELKEVAINKYFANVDKKNLDGVLSTLHQDAVIHIVTDHLSHSGRDSEISNMLQGYFNSYQELWHGNFRSIIDEEKQLIVLKFDWKIKDQKSSLDTGSNVNVFTFKDGKILNIAIYKSTQNNPLK